MGRRSRGRDNETPIDTPVGPHSEVGEIHAWLDELARLRVEHDGNAAALEQIDIEIARAIGWLHGRFELSGEAE